MFYTENYYFLLKTKNASFLNQRRTSAIFQACMTILRYGGHAEEHAELYGGTYGSIYRNKKVP